MPHFNKRHYQAIAQVMQAYAKLGVGEKYSDRVTRNAHGSDVQSLLSLMFMQDNPLFKRDLFIQACQPGANVRATKVKAA